MLKFSKLKFLLIACLMAFAMVFAAACGTTDVTTDDERYGVYQLAVTQGYEGTYDEWLASIKGAKGDKGDTGEQGPKGDKGDTGAVGAAGEKGDKGDTGAAGAAGEKGDKGDTGAAGAAGDKGDKGDKGNGIVSIEKTATDSNTDTYTITFTDGTSTTFTVTNGLDGSNGKDGIDGQDGAAGKDGKDGSNGTDGNGIASVEKTSTDGNVDTYTITFTDGTSTTFTVTNAPVNQTAIDTAWYTDNAEASVFTLETKAQLFGFASLVSTGTELFENKEVKLGRDIDLAGDEWLPIGGPLAITQVTYGQYAQSNVAGDDTTTFRGTFNGDFHAIRNLAISRNAYSYSAMFNTAKNAVFKNLILNVNINKPLEVCSALVSSATNCKFDGVKTSGTITGRGGSGIVAILEGTAKNLVEMKNCTNNVDMTFSAIRALAKVSEGVYEYRNGSLVAGGLVWQMVIKTGVTAPNAATHTEKVFIGCANTGIINIDTNIAPSYVWAGQLIGSTTFSGMTDAYFTLEIENFAADGQLIVSNKAALNSSCVFSGVNKAGAAVKSGTTEHLTQNVIDNYLNFGRIYKTLGINVI